MNKKSETIIFFGNERLATGVTTTAPTLRGLLERGYHVGMVIVNYTAPTSRTAASRELEVVRLAQEHNIPVLAPKKVSAIADELQSLRPALGILLAYGKIIPQAIIDIFPGGIVNLHPSLLPLHRGSIPIESVILEGAAQTGVSLMQLNQELDAGPLFAQASLPLSDTESKQSLYDTLIELGDTLLFESLPGILDGSLTPTPQDHSKASYDGLLTKENGTLDWSKPAARLEREIRAFAEWPKSRTAMSSLEIVITKAHMVDARGEPGKTAIISKQPVIYAAQQALAIDSLKPAGKKEMTGEAFLAGYKQLFLAG
jgi:methionyl-tRNA formyltransferase